MVRTKGGRPPQKSVSDQVIPTVLPTTQEELVHLGFRLRHSKKYEAALEAFQKALCIGQSSVITNRAKLGLAKVLVTLSRFQDALVHLEGLETCPEHASQVLMLRAKVQLFLGNYVQARYTAETAVSCNDEEDTRRLVRQLAYIESRMTSYWALRSSKCWSAAEEVLDEVFRLEPTVTGAYWLMLWSAMLLIKNEMEQAVAFAQRAAEQPDSTPHIVTHLALCLFLEDKPTEASGILHSFDLAQVSEAVRSLLERITNIEELRKDARELYEGGQSNHERGIELLSNALQILDCKTEEAQGGYLRGALLLERAQMKMKGAKSGLLPFLGFTRKSDILSSSWEDLLSAPLSPEIRLENFALRAEILMTRQAYLEAAKLYHTLSQEPSLTEDRRHTYEVAENRCQRYQCDYLRQGGVDVSHYALLGVVPTATIEEIRSAYKAAVLIYHPDRNGTADSFVTLRGAYEAVLHSRGVSP